MKTLRPNVLPVLARFLHDTRGATAVEYALIATIIGIGIVVGVRAIPEALNTFFNNTADALK